MECAPCQHWQGFFSRYFWGKKHHYLGVFPLKIYMHFITLALKSFVMNLMNHLKKSGYDLLDGPIRNHQPLQLWVKKGINRPELYFEHLKDVFLSDQVIRMNQYPVLNVEASRQIEHDYSLGLALLKDMMKAIGGTPLHLTAGIEKGKKISISYKDAYTSSSAIGDLQSYLSQSQLHNSNDDFIRYLNNNQVILITGVVFAKKLTFEIATEQDLDMEWVAKLQSAKDPKLTFSLENKNKIKMTANGTKDLPIAVKASRLDFDQGKFSGMRLITDNRNFF